MCDAAQHNACDDEWLRKLRSGDVFLPGRVLELVEAAVQKERAACACVANSFGEAGKAIAAAILYRDFTSNVA